MPPWRPWDTREGSKGLREGSKAPPREDSQGPERAPWDRPLFQEWAFSYLLVEGLIRPLSGMAIGRTLARLRRSPSSLACVLQS